RPIPSDLPHEAVIAATHHRHLVERLASLRGRGRSVDLTCNTRGQRFLRYEDAAGQIASMNVPLSITGHPPPITSDPQHLASALAIGPKLCLLDGSTPAVTRALTGNGLCVVMPIRISRPQVDTPPKASAA